MSRITREDIEVEITRLHGLDLEGLRQAWRAVFGRAAAAHLLKHTLLRILAYRLQAEAFGDLTRSTVHVLNESTRGSGTGTVPPPIKPGGMRPGTVLVREHDSEHHRVMVMPDGFAWNGGIYPSLSKVAQAITGTKWNGPRFFGLRERQS